MNRTGRTALLLACVSVITSNNMHSNMDDTLNSATHLRFTKLVPEIGKPDHFWGKLTVEQRLQLKKTGENRLNDIEFKHIVRQW